MANGKKSDGARLEAAERRQQAFELRKRGVSYRGIGAELDISEAQAHRDVQRGLAQLAELERASAEEYRAMELARLDRAVLALAPKLRIGDPQVVSTWIRLSESRRKLLGLDAPTAIDVQGTVSPAYIALRATVLQLLPAEQRVLLADALDQVIDASTVDGSDDGA
jgi:IS30 family transposase